MNAEGALARMRLDDFADELCEDQFQAVAWPNLEGERTAYVQLLQTRIKKLEACQVLIVKTTADAPGNQARFFITTRLEDNSHQVVHAVAPVDDRNLIL